MGILGGQGAASASLRPPVTKGNWEFMSTLRLGERGGRRRCLARTRAEVAVRGRGPGVRAGPGSCQPACLPSPHPTRQDPVKVSAVSPLLSTAHTCSCPSEVYGEVATVLVGEGHGAAPRRGVLRPLRPPPPLAAPQLSAALRGWRRSASLLAVESRETPRNREGTASPDKCLQVPPARYLHPEGQQTHRVQLPGFLFVCLFFPQSHPVDNKPRSRVL